RRLCTRLTLLQYSDYLFFVKPAVLHCSSSFFAAFAATGKFQLKMAQFRRARSQELDRTKDELQDL
ncbi:MAG: hypothetical protein M3Y50_06930, partial [Acidobacteriota bacterium]|nr:hypothetical protein [Acidobacteriota bacterium]